MDNDSSVTTSLKSVKRKPYHYNSTSNWSENNTIQNGSHGVTVAVTVTPCSSSSNSNDHEEPVPNEDYVSSRALYSRYLYYNQLRRRIIPESDDILLIPSHVIPTEFFYPQYTRSSDGKQGSVVTIFAIWNTMMGTSILNMPWAMERAGVVPGIILLLLMACISFYTAYRILEVFEAHANSVVTDLAVLCKKLLGRFAQITAVIFSVLTILGALVVYWVLMSNFLFHTVDFFYSSANHDSFAFVKNESSETVYCPSNDSTTSSGTDDDDADLFHKIWNLHRTVPLFLVAILGPIACVRSPTFFMKFNSLGTVSVVYLLVFVIVKWCDFGVNLNFVDPTNPSYVPLFKASCPALAGMLSLAFFIHNCIVTIMKNNRNQTNNKRDLALAFFFVVLTYFLIGGIFYIIFPLNKICIEDNFLNNFRSSDLWTFTARIFLFFQMLTVFPLLMYILRVQVCYALTKQEPTTTAIYSITLFVISICVMFAIFLPKIGTIIRFTGAICGLVYVFCIPIGLHLKWKSSIGALSWTRLLIHLVLLAIGFTNVVLQFVVTV